MQLDISLLQNPQVPSGLDPQLFKDPKLLETLKAVNQKVQNKDYGFIEVLKTSEHIDNCQKIYDKFSWADHLVVVGIGGSDLGARMLNKALKKSDKKVSFIGDSTDPSPYYDLFKNLDPQKTVINIISKSGSTTETAASFLILKKFYQDKSLDWSKHFIFTTDKKEGILKKIAEKEKMETLIVPDEVGGRFSVLSPVGLFPALFMGIDIKILVSEANIFAQKLISDNSDTNPAWLFALQNYLFQKHQNIDNIVFFSYIAKMKLFTNWFRQLWAESLGKDSKGILPIKAIGPADQHSQAQFYNQGKNINTYIFLSAQDYGEDFTISNPDIEDLKYLDNTKLSNIIKAECQATRFALAKSDKKSSHLLIDKIDEKSVAQLIVLFELSVVYAAKLLGVNPFDQPGVEAGKQYMYGLLGREGFEDKKKEIENL